MKKERLKLVFPGEVGRTIVFNDHEDFDVIEETLEGESRWENYYSVVIQRKSDGLFFAGGHSRGKTESQDVRPYEYEDAEFKQVFKVTKTIEVYE